MQKKLDRALLATINLERAVIVLDEAMSDIGLPKSPPILSEIIIAIEVGLRKLGASTAEEN